MNILLIGGCGYIGSYLYSFLKERYSSFNINTVDLEWFGNFINEDNIIIDYKYLSKKFINKYDVVILLAGHSSVKMSQNNMCSVVKNNVFNFVSLLEKINKNQIFIYASSSSVYGDTKQNIVNEDFISFEPNNCYDLSKYEIDCYAKLSNKNYFGLRFGTVNGFSLNFRNDIMINAMTYNAIKNKEVFCFNPEIHRPILGIHDLCRSIECIIFKSKFKDRGFYNLCSFNSTAKEISKSVADYLAVPLNIIEEIPQNITNIKLQSKVYNFMIDSSKFEKTFNFSFEQDVNSIVFSILSNFSKMNKDNRSNAQIYN